MKEPYENFDVNIFVPVVLRFYVSKFMLAAQYNCWAAEAIIENQDCSEVTRYITVDEHARLCTK